MKTVYFRVDGNEIIATGHIMRCLSIAKKIQLLGGKVQFILADNSPEELIRQHGFECIILKSIWNDLEQETGQMVSLIKRRRAKVLFVDSYYVTEYYLQTLSQYTKVVYLDDLKRFIYPVHTIINYGLWEKNEYEIEIYRKNGLSTKFLLGPQYIPLREEFNKVLVNIRPLVKSVLITTGGTDQLHVARKLLDAVVGNLELDNIEYHVIVGCFNKDREELYKIKQNNTNVHIHENVRNMSYWMEQCDVAVSAAGTTLYELAACGIPTVCVEVADNQRGADKWQKEGYMLYAGNVADNMKVCIENVVKDIVRYKNNLELRNNYSKKMQQLVDGGGAERIARYLLDLQY